MPRELPIHERRVFLRRFLSGVAVLQPSTPPVLAVHLPRLAEIGHGESVARGCPMGVVSRMKRYLRADFLRAGRAASDSSVSTRTGTRTGSTAAGSGETRSTISVIAARRVRIPCRARYASTAARARFDQTRSRHRPPGTNALASPTQLKTVTSG
jgi:hypothetical protein